MSILTSASAVSVWRGYEYYTDRKVIRFVQSGPDEYVGEVSGSAAMPYHVKINTVHVRQSKCDCPHADGKRIICKHMVALYFSAFPEEARRYIAEVESDEREEDEDREAYYEGAVEYVMSLTKKQLQEALLAAILDDEDYSGDWQY